MTRVLEKLQRALESLYGVEAEADVRDFIITAERRDGLHPGRLPREQLLLRQEDDALEIGLYVDEVSLQRIEKGLDEGNRDAFLLAVEGVSHFVYVSVRAHQGRPFSGLELELQAEVDKYMLSLLAAWRAHQPAPEGLRDRLYARVAYHADLSAEERDRYATANDAAADYTATLEQRFLRRRAYGDMLEDVRRFYRLDCAAKLDHIASKAA